jgi:hypothetical protein
MIAMRPSPQPGGSLVRRSTLIPILACAGQVGCRVWIISGKRQLYAAESLAGPPGLKKADVGTCATCNSVDNLVFFSVLDERS